MCRKEFWDNNHFGSRNSTLDFWALEIPEGLMSSKRHSDTLCVKANWKGWVKMSIFDKSRKFQLTFFSRNLFQVTFFYNF